jgi:hypothetical protein
MQERRSYRIVHEDYIVEWLGINYPAGSWRTNVPLGDKLIQKEVRLTAEERRQLGGMLGANADAIAIIADGVHIIEAMVRHEPGALEDLLKYKELLAYTSGLEHLAEKPIRLILLTPLSLGWYEKFANKLGIEVKYYSPPWILEYLHSYPRAYWRGKLSRLSSV